MTDTTDDRLDKACNMLSALVDAYADVEQGEVAGVVFTELDAARAKLDALDKENLRLREQAGEMAEMVERLRKVEHAACVYRDAYRRGRPYEVIEAYEYDLDRALGLDDAATGTTRHE